MRSSRTRKEITDAYGRYIQRISLRQLWQRLYLKIKIMNLNITPTDKISEELAAIDAFLNITMSEEGTTSPSISPEPGSCWPMPNIT